MQMNFAFNKNLWDSFFYQAGNLDSENQNIFIDVISGVAELSRFLL